MRFSLTRHATVFLVAVLGAAMVLPLLRQKDDAQQDVTFDFWVLALSWSPTYCLGDGKNDIAQCGTNRPDGFIVHGLWPQFERGYPQNCAIGPERIERRFADDMSDLMPTPRLVFYQWRKHGRCSGMTPEAYFAKVREAAETVHIPRKFSNISRSQLVAPEAIEAAFATANPGLDLASMAAICHRNRLVDVRICLTRDMEFRACREVDDDGCPANAIDMPAPQ